MANNRPSLAEIAARSRVKRMDWGAIGDKFSEGASSVVDKIKQAKTEKTKEEATEGLNEDDKNKVENKVDEQNSEAEKEEIINKNEEAKEEENESLNLQTFTDIDGNKIQ